MDFIHQFLTKMSLFTAADIQSLSETIPENVTNQITIRLPFLHERNGSMIQENRLEQNKNQVYQYD